MRLDENSHVVGAGEEVHSKVAHDRAGIERYLGRGMHRVGGWLNPLSARILARISQFQSTIGIHGATGEIGVHHGKLWLVLHLTTDRSEKCFAIDIFDDQSKNVDASGRGDAGIFEANIRRHSWGDDNVVMIKASSLELDAEDLLDRFGQARLVSIDGGHTDECTFHDLGLAQAITVSKAVVVLDDYFNPSWPDVSTGAARYLLDMRSELRPFAITPNKLFLSRTPHTQTYREQLLRDFSAFFEKSSRMYGEPVNIYQYTPGLLDALTTSAGVALLPIKKVYWRWRAQRRGNQPISDKD